MQQYSDIIKKRRSIRTYDNRPLKEDDSKKIKDYISKLPSHPFGLKTNLNLINIDNKGESKQKLGTYGFIKGARSYVTAATTRTQYSLETLGYQMEKIILFATSLGLGTCWLGGTFNRSAFANALDLDKGEFLPIITSIGYESEKKRLREKLVQLSASASKRKLWSEIFYLNGFDTPLTVDEAGKLQNAFEMVRLAPSASNKQPWLLVLDKEKGIIHFYLNRLNNYVGNKLGFEMQQIDIGIAMCHLECALQDDGIHGEYVIKDPNIKIPEVSGASIYYEVSFKLN